MTDSLSKLQAKAESWTWISTFDLVNQPLQFWADFQIGYLKSICSGCPKLGDDPMLLSWFPPDPNPRSHKGGALSSWTKKQKLQFIRDLCHRHRGELREVWGRWVLKTGEFPDPLSSKATSQDRNLFQDQFALDAYTQKALVSFEGKGKGKGQGRTERGLWSLAIGKGNDIKTGRWRFNLKNRMVWPSSDGDKTHYRREAMCCGLPQFFFEMAKEFSASDIYRYYMSLKVICLKRVHGSTCIVRHTASLQRKEKTGHYGFPP